MADTILVVDDDSAILEILEVNLAAEGYDVRSAGGGAQALEIARRARPVFVGHVGGDDFALVLPEPAGEHMATEIVSASDVMAPTLYGPADARRGFVEGCDRTGELRRFPSLAISLGIATTAHRRFHSAGELAAVASEAKHRAKAKPGRRGG